MLPTLMVPTLTHRKREVLLAVADGLSAKQIAERIHLAPRTVENHIENCKLKLRARNRPHMVSLACEHGLLHYQSSPDLFPGSRTGAIFRPR